MARARDLDSILQELNPQQRQAVECSEGRVLILAGAGSGKTKVLMSRIAYLIATGRAEPQQLLGLTFTNKAAQEMRQRLGILIGKESAKKVTLCTFHSFCLQLLREYAYLLGFTRRFTLYHEHDVRRLASQIARDELEHEGTLPSLLPSLERVSLARQQGIQPSDLPEGKEPWHHEFCQTLFDRIKLAFRAYNAMDFDALIEYATELLEKYPEVKAKLLDRYRYVMIDEYQDTNPVQDRLALQLAGHGNLCVVGDDDQSIYGWRGSEVRNILEFPADTTIKLEQNYRSSNSILQAANHVIAINEQRYKKTLWSHKGEGSLLELFHAPSETLEAQAVVSRMLALKVKYGLRWRDFAILYRSNALARAFETALLRQAWQETPDSPWKSSIPYEVFGGDSFYDRREVRDLLSYLRVIVNPLDQEALLSIINQPRRGVGEASVDALTQRQRQEGGTLMEYLTMASNSDQTHPTAAKGLQSLLGILELAREKFSQESLSSTLRWLVEAIDYEKAIKEEVKSEAMRDLKRKNIAQLIQSAEEFEKTASEKGLDALASFACASQLDTPGMGSRRRHEDAVHLMTFHSAKGLEFPAVYLVGIEDHILPHERSLDMGSLEEERRLFYVALTRAEKFLTISMATVRERYGKAQASKPSRFLFDIPKELLDIRQWNSLDESHASV